jgi:cysteine-S-conjugate beta-lyase
VSDQDQAKTHLVTELIHHPYQAPDGFASPVTAVHKGSTVIFKDVAAMRQRDWRSRKGYTYGLHGTPTTFTLEERLCTLEGGRHCVLLPSGLAALANVALALLKAGDEVLLPDNVYGPNKALAEHELAQWGITHQYYDPMNPADLAARLSDKTRLVWLEAPGSVTMEFPDLLGLVHLCRQHGAARSSKEPLVLAIDNTWGAGLAFQPFALGVSPDGERLGVDVSVHALTKYPSGGGDVLMGSVVTCDDALHWRIKATHMRMGWGVAANDCETLLRSLPSMALRYQAQDACARHLAQWLGQQKAVVQVLHPALTGSPGHAHWLALCGQAGETGLAAGLFSIMLDPTWRAQQVDAFCDALKLFKIGYSWGGPISLVMPYGLQEMRHLPTPDLKPGHLVRFSVGLEHQDDLRADLSQALEAASLAG